MENLDYFSALGMEVWNAGWMEKKALLSPNIPTFHSSTNPSNFVKTKSYGHNRLLPTRVRSGPPGA